MKAAHRPERRLAMTKAKAPSTGIDILDRHIDGMTPSELASSLAISNMSTSWTTRDQIQARIQARLDALDEDLVEAEEMGEVKFWLGFMHGRNVGEDEC
jgi:hypothetical protein